jgi:hypothetical protein
LPLFWTVLSVQSCPAWQEPVPNCGVCFARKEAKVYAMVSLNRVPGLSAARKSRNEEKKTKLELGVAFQGISLAVVCCIE